MSLGTVGRQRRRPHRRRESGEAKLSLIINAHLVGSADNHIGTRMPPLDTKEIALYLVTQGNWTAAYEQEAREMNIPAARRGLRIRGIRSGLGALLTEVRRVLPKAELAACGEYPDEFCVIFADPAEIEKAKDRALSEKHRRTERHPGI